MELLNNTEDIIQLIGFHVGEKLFGADILSIREILREPTIEKAEKMPDIVAGIIRLRGEAIPVVDLRRRIGRTAGKIDEGAQTWVLVTQIGEATMGLVADGVTRILRIDPGNILPAPEIIVSGLATPYIRGVCETDLGMLVALNFDRLFTAEEIQSVKMMDVK